MAPNLYDERRGAPESHHKKILIVEDDMTLKILWQQIVRKLDMPADITWATSEGTARKAIDAIKNRGGHYDVVICDIFLSGNNTGIDFWRTHRDEPTDFIFTSGVSEDKFKKLFEGEKGFHMFLPKPLDSRICIAAINATLRKNRPAPTRRAGSA